MIRASTFLCVCSAFISLAHPQNFDVKQHTTLQDMIDYAKQFDHHRNAKPQRVVATTESSSNQDDPIINELFKEFLLQYQQLASEQKAKAPSATATTTTTEAPFRVEFPILQQTTIQSRRPIFPNTNPAPEASPIPQRRRISPGRKSNTPDTTTPFSTLLNRGHFPHHESALEATTPFPSLRQKYFGVNSQTTKKPASKIQHYIPPTFQTTPAPQIVQEASTPVAKFQIPQNLLRTTIKVPSKVSTKIKTPQHDRFDEAEFKRQSESAKYEFSSDIEDGINGNLQQREEVREGSAVRGKYSYSDGYYKRTVHYEADDKGYRVVMEEVEPLQGPQTNPDGNAKVTSYVDGNTVNYQITKDDIMRKNQKSMFNEIENLDYDESK